MTKIYVILIGVIFYSSCKPRHENLLDEVYANLNKLSSIKYTADHEYVSNGKVVYENTDTVIIEFHNENLNQLRYHLNSAESQLVFNGEEMFQSITAEKIITNSETNDPDYFNNPLIYSLSYLRQVLPKLSNNESVKIVKVKDTLINEVELVFYDFLLDSAYIHPTKYEFVDFDQSSKFSLLLNKTSKLPYKIISPNNDGGIISQTFKNIEPNININEEVWTGKTLPINYIRITEKEYDDNRKNKMESHVGQFLTDWKLPDLHTNSQIELKNLKGKVLLLDFWFKGCAPCLSSIPSLNRFTSKYSYKDFKIYGVEFYETHDKTTLMKYVKMNKVKYPNLYKGKKLALNYGITGGPTFMLVDKQGKIIHLKSGFSDEHMNEIDDLIRNNI